MNKESSETSSQKRTPKSKYANETSDVVMMRVNQQKSLMLKNPSADNFIETSKAMVQFFAGDPNYELPYVIVSGIKVYVEGKVEETEESESMSIHEKNRTFHPVENEE